MITYWKNLMVDESKFVGLVRGLMGALSAVFLAGDLDFGILPENLRVLVPALGVFLAFFMRSSTDGTPKEVK